MIWVDKFLLKIVPLLSFTLIDSSNGKYEDIKVADDYVSAIPLTLGLQDKAKDSGRIGVHASLSSLLSAVIVVNIGRKVRDV